MAEINTVIAEASQDLQTIEDFVNLPAGSDVRPRLLPSVNVGTLAGIRDAIFEAGGLPAEPFETLAKMNTDGASLLDGQLAMVTDDTVNNGLYVKTAGAWVKSGYDPLAQAKSYTDTAKSSAISTAAGDATTKANTAKSEAISASATDATTKANTAKSEAIAAAATDATSKASAAQAAAIAYSDNNKIDFLDISYTYTNGNMIGDKTPKYTNYGISGGIAANPSVDSLVLRVDAGDVLYMHNNTQRYTSSLGSRFNFFASDPSTNRTQTAITHTAITETDAATGIVYQKVTVPPTAEYLMINTRTVTGGDTYNMTWAVHKSEFSPSFTTGTEVVYRIKDIPLIGSDDYLRAATYTDTKLQDYEKLSVSTKNKFKGGLVGKMRATSNGITASAYENDYITEFVPVEFGKFYTISGINTELLRTNIAVVAATSDKTNASFIKSLGSVSASTITVYIDDATIKYITLPLTDNNRGTLLQAQQLPLQIEEGEVATTYEPYLYSANVQKAVAIIDNREAEKAAEYSVVVLSDFIELNKVRRPDDSELGVIAKDISPLGMMYKLQGSVGGTKLNTSNNIFTQVTDIKEGRRTLRANLAKLVGGVSTKGALNGTSFTVPSGQFDNPNTLPDLVDKYSLSGYVHPSIAYDSVGVAGFKYWMIASVLPSGNMNGATWEDEDMFVSNDAKNWQRIRSLYEDEKSYTTETLRLPPQSLARVDARQNAILPVPAQGDTIEMSMPADNGAPAIDRQMVLLNGTKTPFKHDPAILIHGGFVYTYHSFHVPYAERDGGSNKFIVCVRTSNGVDWDVVRSDGSTMRLTEESSRQIFTKDEQGRYNYIAYFYSYGGSNPEIIKYGENDFEFIYGGNFSHKYAGTTPYNFDFATKLPFKDMGSTNHPATVLSGNTLYLINNQAVYSSTDRGASFTKLPHYPMWLGGVSGIPYKKALCVGAGGKLILVEAQRYDLPTYDLITTGGYNQTNRDHQMTVYEYPSVADFESKATNGFVDAYIDVQLCKVNYKTRKRDFIAVSGLSNTSTAQGVNRPLQSVKVAELDFKSDDLLFVYVTLNAHSGAEIRFGGIDIT